MVTICTKMGISNHEEYSLVREMMDDEKEKTLTLRRDKSIAKDQKKLDEMKKKLHTDDELEWLDHSRTLREQGVLDLDTLLLRRKFFFSDQNVDQRDPVQLNLLYVQGKSNLITAGKMVGEASQEVMTGIGETADDMDRMYQVVAPTISSPACQEQMIHATKGVAHFVEGIVEAAQQSCRDDKLLADLGTAATAVTQALNDLLQHIKKGAGPTAAGESHEDAVDTILTVTDRLFSSVGDAHEMVRQARQLAQATSSLVGAIRGEAEGHSDSDMQKRPPWPPPDYSLMPPRTWWKLPRAVRRVRTTRSSRRDYEALQRISWLPQISPPATHSKGNSSGG
ncbi:uncharacterized protein [Magallana gigas]|uniref:uncharacterized protein isoform X2 n=1 Tax=Magallana gigas TaxID=29159 RepID=UPI003342BA0F